MLPGATPRGSAPQGAEPPYGGSAPRHYIVMIQYYSDVIQYWGVWGQDAYWHCSGVGVGGKKHIELVEGIVIYRFFKSIYYNSHHI